MIDLGRGVTDCVKVFQEKSLAVTLGGRAGIFIATDGLWVVDVEHWVYARRCRRKDRAPQECDPSSRRPALRLETGSREGPGLFQAQPGAVRR